MPLTLPAPDLPQVPLGLVDLFKQFPQLQTDHPTAYLAVRFLFALTFVAVRLVIWLWVVYHFWFDLYLCWSGGQLQEWPVYYISILHCSAPSSLPASPLISPSLSLSRLNAGSVMRLIEIYILFFTRVIYA